VLVATAEDLPIGAIVCAANRQDATFTGEALASLVLELPLDKQEPDSSQPTDSIIGARSDGKLSEPQRRELRRQLNQGPDVRPLPYLRADGNFAKVPAKLAARQQHLRLWAPDKHQGQSRRGLGRIRSSVERAHALLNQFGRVCRRFDRDWRRYLAWVQLACCIIMMRQGFFP